MTQDAAATLDPRPTAPSLSAPVVPSISLPDRPRPAPLPRRRDPAPDAATAAGIDKVEKAAIVLVALGPEAAAGLLADVGEERITRFARAVASMGETPPQVVDAVLTEFLQRLHDDSAVEGGRREARRFLDQVMEGTEADEIMKRLEARPQTVWAGLGEVDDMRVAAWLEDEHPQVAAVALARLSAAKAARVLELLPPEGARRIVLGMGPAAAADAATVTRIEDAIRRDVLPVARAGQSGLTPAGLIGAVMNHVSPSVRARLLEEMAGAAPALARAVRGVMFTFENIVERVEPRDVIQIAKTVDEEMLIVALKADAAAGGGTSDFILGNISKRLAERLRDDIAAAPDPSTKDAEAAQGALVAAIVELRDSGSISLRLKDDDDG